MYRPFRFLFAAIVLVISLSFTAGAEDRRLVIVAGKPSHPPRMHEFNAGVQLLEKCLADVPGLKTSIVLNGWPANEQIFKDADAIVFFMDGGGRHEVVQENGRRLKLVDDLAAKGVGLGFMHYGVTTRISSLASFMRSPEKYSLALWLGPRPSPGVTRR